MNIYLLRHGETEYNKQKRYQGTLDIPLSAEGLARLQKAPISPKVVYISPLIRARHTAEILFPDAKLVEVEDLKEMCFGVFQGRNYIEMEKDPDYIAWVGEDCTAAAPAARPRRSSLSVPVKPAAACWRMHWQLARKSWGFWPTAAPRWL